ncbi:GNAT family N-acetyltransferase [Phanerochaete sordida]|uniref:GNAT family N-acetyltransferase n=1 Tax=Phanerochaete sordida TaxID=48140 RepID=A0A9P3GIA9_9APHY|nr:GNAT family N-acetyltransferase [Phanerochaete sordida]
MAAPFLCLSAPLAAPDDPAHAPRATKSAAGCPGPAAELKLAVPQRMQYRDIPRAVSTTLAAFAADPLNRFLKDTPDSAPPNARTRAARTALLYAQAADDVRSGALWTVAHGASYLRLGDPLHAPDALARAVARLVAGLTLRTLTRMQRARYDAFVRAANAAIADALGDAVADMLLVDGLATAPACQGRGYARALVRVATDLADARSTRSWLVSSNAANRGFYGACGFRGVRTFYLGADDATWTRAPVPIDIVSSFRAECVWVGGADGAV